MNRSIIIRTGSIVLAATGITNTTLSQSDITNAKWTLIDPMHPGEIEDIGVASENPDDFYVATNPDGAWMSADGGATDLTWLFSGMGLFEVHMTRTVIAEADNLRRYTMSVGGGMRTSADGGQTWVSGKFPSGAPHVNRPWVALAASPVDAKIILAGGDGVIMRSTDAAATAWSPTTGVPNDVVITDIEFVAGTDDWVGSVVWAATADCAMWEEIECAGLFTDGRGVLGSADGGQVWYQIPISTQPNDPKNLVHAIATIPNRAGWPQAATEDGLWGTVDYGATWVDYTPAGLSSRRIIDVFYAKLPLSTIYIATVDGVYHGNVVGGTVTWNATAFGGTPTDFPTALDSTVNDSNLLYAGYLHGDVAKTTDYGVNVTEIHGAHGAYPMATVAIKAGDENTAFVGTVCQQGIFRGDITSPTNVTWTELVRPGGQHFHYVMRVVTHPTTGSIVYSTENDWLWKSTNTGANWTQITPSPGGVHLHGFEIAPSDTTRLSLSNGHGNWGTHTHSLRVWRSDNSGTSWTDYTSGLPQPGTDTSLIDIAVHPNDRDVVYIGTFGSENYPGDLSKGIGQGVLRSLDGGVTWAFVNNGLTGTSDSLFVANVAMRIRNGTLYTYIATLDGIYRMDGQAGTTWVDISPPNERRFEGVAIDPVMPNIIYAGTSAPLGSGSGTPGKIYVSRDAGATWNTMVIKMASLAWSDQYRVRDITVGVNRAYAVVEGSGIYMLEESDLKAIRAVVPGP